VVKKGIMGGWVGWAGWAGWVLHEKPHAAAVNCSDSVWAFGATPAAGKAKPGKPTSWQLIRGFYMPPTHALWLGKWQTEKPPQDRLLPKQLGEN